MGATSGIGGGAVGPWYRVQAMTADGRRGTTAERDYASVLPAVLNAALHRRPFVAGWLSRGGGAPLELITNAGPMPEPGRATGHGRLIEPGRVIAIEASEFIEPGRVIEPGGAAGPGRVIGPGRAVVIHPGGPQPPGGNATAAAPSGVIEPSQG